MYGVHRKHAKTAAVLHCSEAENSVITVAIVKHLGLILKYGGAWQVL